MIDTHISLSTIMKSSNFAALFATGVLSVSSITPMQTQQAVAATFGQTEVKQNKFVAIAVPRNNSYYNLTILEQVSDQRSCWEESGSSPTVIEPLLLDFNFSGICGRNADSNGYSIRHKGRDLGLEYRLTLRRQDNDVLLLGVPSSSSQEPIVLGRTRGVSSSLMKIDLDPGWKFTKRSYKGKTLGHVYLTHEGTLPVGGDIKTAFSDRNSRSEKKSKTRRAKRSSKATPSVSSNRRYRLYVQTSNSRQERLVKSLVPGSFRSSYRGRSVIQAGLFSDRSKARSLERTLKRRGLQTTLLEETGSIPVAKAPSSAFPPVASGSVLRVPSNRVPLGNARGEGDVFGRGNTSTPPPPPNPTLALAKRHRVLVPTSSRRQQSRIRSLVKGAFRSSYRGQSAMQVGSFTSTSEAQDVIELMQRNGFRTIID